MPKKKIKKKFIFKDLLTAQKRKLEKREKFMEMVRSTNHKGHVK